MIRISFSPDFVEEAVLLAEREMTIGDRRAFRRERDTLYEVRDVQARDERFAALHARWFAKLGLDRGIHDTVAESLGPAPRVHAARVLRAAGRSDEGADLVDRVSADRAGVTPLLVLRVRPAAALSPVGLRALLAHELLHVRDMLDPAFGYERSLSADPAPLTETILRDRYRVLWDTTIDGRLSRTAGVADDVITSRRREFEAAFPMLGGEARAAFDAWFAAERPTHADLLAFARMPASGRWPAS